MWIEPDISNHTPAPHCIRLEARFGQKRATAETLWFDVPEMLCDGVSDSGNFWLQAVLPLAFKLQQPLESNVAVD
ncbi:MAG TPA: hypothetical protein VK327_08930, partial [Candidatus Paceibacterota bacterium]|nr:hypothetical protein [Candidatus Paceibacterota bacterium]